MPSDYQSEFDDEFDAPRHQRAFAASLFFGILALLLTWIFHSNVVHEQVVRIGIYLAITICAFIGFFPEYSNDPLSLESTQPETFKERFSLAVIMLTPIVCLYISYSPIDPIFQKLLQSLFIFVIIGATIVGMGVFEKKG